MIQKLRIHYDFAISMIEAEQLEKSVQFMIGKKTAFLFMDAVIEPAKKL
ncbi:MAG: hypothetical protein ACQEWW_23005 [Bacillota bacterium]